MDVGKLLLAATAGMVVLAVALLGAVFLGPAGLFEEPPPANVEDVSDDDLPDGITKREVENASASADDHESTLEDQSYTVELRGTKRVTGSDGETRTTNRTVRLRADGNGNMLLTVIRRGDPPFERLAWTNGSVAVAKVTSRDRTEFQRMDPGRIEQGATGSTTVEQLLRVGDFEPTNVTTVDGRRLIVLTANDSTREARATLGAQRVKSFSGTAQVDGDGRFYYLRIEVTYVDREGDTVTWTVTQRLTDVGSTTVERPEWVPQAIEEVLRVRSPPMVA